MSTAHVSLLSKHCLNKCCPCFRVLPPHLTQKREPYSRQGFDYNFLKKLLSYKGDNALIDFQNISWSVDVEFGHSLLIWHIATDICYYSRIEESEKDYREASKRISDYMLYLLLLRPLMLPKWINRITHLRNTFREATSILHRNQQPVKDAASASKSLIQMHRQCHQPLQQLRRERASKSLLHEGCRLALQIEDQSFSWEVICNVWIEMLTYAASQCEWEAHGQRLRRGGEFLTHVCLLMAELGLSKQYDIAPKTPSVETRKPK
ncbi:hypothetical protein HN51_046261 [Arachis hypogaea]|nr:uncharacterized protein DS421_12g354740 [Arachis hypogaea]